MSFMLLGILNSQAAGGGGAAYDLLETTTLSSSASSVTFSSIDQSYSHLEIRATAKVFSNRTLKARLNNISTASYAWHNLRGDGSTISTQGASNQSNIDIGEGMSNINTSGAFAGFIISVLDYSSSEKNTTTRAFTGYADSSSFSNVNITSGFLNSTQAINQIEFFLNGTNFISGTRFSLYGIKGA